MNRCFSLPRRLISTGEIPRKACEYPGYLETKTETHHPDYSKPREVVWLCKRHYREETNRELYGKESSEPIVP